MKFILTVVKEICLSVNFTPELMKPNFTYINAFFSFMKCSLPGINALRSTVNFIIMNMKVNFTFVGFILVMVNLIYATKEFSNALFILLLNILIFKYFNLYLSDKPFKYLYLLIK